MEKILILDNYDSFTYNIVHLINELGYETEVFRNDRITVEEVGKYQRIVLSPGPGIPEEAGILPEVIRRYAPDRHILGICLGEQAIGECFGSQIIKLALSLSWCMHSCTGDGFRQAVYRTWGFFRGGTLSFLGSEPGKFAGLPDSYG